MFLLGPVASWIVNKLGLRLSTMLAALPVSASLLLTSYMTDFAYLFATFSIPFGVGSSVLLMASVKAICVYFDKWLSIAYGRFLKFAQITTRYVQPSLATSHFTVSVHRWLKNIHLKIKKILNKTSKLPRKSIERWTPPAKDGRGSAEGKRRDTHPRINRIHVSDWLPSIHRMLEMGGSPLREFSRIAGFMVPIASTTLINNFNNEKS